MTYYLTYVFIMANLTGNINLISAGIQYALFIIFSLVTFVFIDSKFYSCRTKGHANSFEETGRRPLLIYGAVGMGACHFVIGKHVFAELDPLYSMLIVRHTLQAECEYHLY